jgi:hypothetical protein
MCAISIPTAGQPWIGPHPCVRGHFGLSTCAGNRWAFRQAGWRGDEGQCRRVELLHRSTWSAHQVPVRSSSTRETDDEGGDTRSFLVVAPP